MLIAGTGTCGCVNCVAYRERIAREQAQRVDTLHRVTTEDQFLAWLGGNYIYIDDVGIGERDAQFLTNVLMNYDTIRYAAERPDVPIKEVRRRFTAWAKRRDEYNYNTGERIGGCPYRYYGAPRRAVHFIEDRDAWRVIRDLTWEDVFAAVYAHEVA